MTVQTDPKMRAQSTASHAGIAHEDGVTVHEVFTSRRSRNYVDVVGDFIPGASLLARASCRILLATTEGVYLFRGASYDRPRAGLAVYPIERGGFSFGEDSITLPAGEVLYMNRRQAAALASAIGVDDYRELARVTASKAGIDEAALTVASATEPKPRKKNAGTKVFDVVLGGGELDFRDDVFHRTVLVTDQRIHLFEGRYLTNPGKRLATYELDAISGLGDTVATTLPGGRTISLARDDRTRVLGALSTSSERERRNS
jgi:hypothetical protein